MLNLRILAALLVVILLSAPQLGYAAPKGGISKDLIDDLKQLKERLDELSERFSDDVAYHAYLKMRRQAAGLGED